MTPPDRVVSSDADPERDDSFKRVLVLGKVKDILNLFTMEEPELDLKRIRQGSGLPNSTCVRLVRNMCNDGLLIQVGTKYRIGISVMRWAAVARQGLSLVEIANPSVVSLRDATGESAGLFVRDAHLRVCIALSESTRAVGRRLTLGNALPLHVGAPGKTLLAFDPASDGLLDSLQLDPMTDRTYTDRLSLGQELTRIRRDGFAVSHGEWDIEVAGVAAPIMGADSRLVAAIGISGPLTRLTKAVLPDMIKAVTSAASEVSAAHGFLLAKG
jgi:DNA-binding IclR family transcriptional regulator